MLRISTTVFADVAQLVERQLPKLNVASSTLVVRSYSSSGKSRGFFLPLNLEREWSARPLLNRPHFDRVCMGT